MPKKAKKAPNWRLFFFFLNLLQTILFLLIESIHELKKQFKKFLHIAYYEKEGQKRQKMAQKRPKKAKKGKIKANFFFFQNLLQIENQCLINNINFGRQPAPQMACLNIKKATWTFISLPRCAWCAPGIPQTAGQLETPQTTFNLGQFNCINGYISFFKVEKVNR